MSLITERDIHRVRNCFKNHVCYSHTETVTMVKETTLKCHVVIQHLFSISNLPTKLLKLQSKKHLPHHQHSQLTFISGERDYARSALHTTNKS